MYKSTIANVRVLELALFLFCLPFATATPIFSPTCGAGSNNIPDAVVDNVGITTPGVLSCGFVVNTPGVVAPGNAITVGLLGFIHEASGDLIVTLTHYTDASKTVIFGASQTLFYRIGKTSADPNDFGYSAQFGDLSGGENYTFNSGFTTNLWTIASHLGSADFIPGAAAGFNSGYTTHGPFSGTPNTFSALFAGQPIGGYWELNITDNAAGPSAPSVAGSLLQFSLDINSAMIVPEPGSWVLCALGLLGMALPGVKRYTSSPRIRKN